MIIRPETVVRLGADGGKIQCGIGGDGPAPIVVSAHGPTGRPELETSGSSGVVLASVATAAAWGLLAWIARTSLRPLPWMLALVALAWLALAWAARRPTRGSGWIILLGAVVFRLIALMAPPIMEDDHYRFLWDGYRFATTGSPYGEAPAAQFGDDTIPEAFQRVLDGINYPEVPTIYGPLAEWAFRFCHWMAPAKLWPWKLILLGCDLAVIGMLWSVLSTRGRLLLAWCPLSIFETGFNAHPDALALALVVLVWWLGRKSWPGLAGAAAGLAVSAKIFALLIVPFLLWRLPRRAWLTALAAVIAAYVPFWLDGSAADLTSLRAMGSEWEFNSSLHALAAAIVRPTIARMLCALVFAVIWLRWLTRETGRTDSPSSLPPGEWIFGAFLLLSATANPWYALWLWPFVAPRPSATGVAALVAVSLSYATNFNLDGPSAAGVTHPVWVRPLEFGLIGLGALYDWRRRSIASAGSATSCFSSADSGEQRNNSMSPTAPR